MNVLTQKPSKAEQAIRDAYFDLIKFGKLFLPGDFLKTQPTPAFHYEVAQELMSSSNKPCALILPRDSAKTIYTKALILHDFVFAKKAKEWGFAEDEVNLLYGWCADNQKKSIKNVAYIRYNLKFNKKLLYYFGDDILCFSINIFCFFQAVCDARQRFGNYCIQGSVRFGD